MGPHPLLGKSLLDFPYRLPDLGPLTRPERTASAGSLSGQVGVCGANAPCQYDVAPLLGQEYSVKLRPSSSMMLRQTPSRRRRPPGVGLRDRAKYAVSHPVYVGYLDMVFDFFVIDEHVEARLKCLR